MQVIKETEHASEVPAKVHVVGGGLAGVEAAWQCLKQGLAVVLYEMRPHKTTPAHKTGDLAELVCSNSFKSLADGTAAGQLKSEMIGLDSLVVEAARKARVPAGQALAVDRAIFSAGIKKSLLEFDRFEILEEEVESLPSESEMVAKNEYWVVATGPLTSRSLVEHLRSITQMQGELHFYDAIAPIIDAESINFDEGFWADRWAEPDHKGDYFNIPLDKDQYISFVNSVIGAEKMPLHSFEETKYFESCLPIEVMAARGIDTLRFGPMRPVGFLDPKTGKRPYAVIQLRQETSSGSMMSMVGFQSKMKWPEQKRVFQALPTLGQAEFYRYGSIHRNTYMDCPKIMTDDLSLRCNDRVYLAGQITGVEGYSESACVGLAVGRAVCDKVFGRAVVLPPQTTIMGALLQFIRLGTKSDYSPMNANLGLLPSIKRAKGITKADVKKMKCQNAQEAFTSWKSLNN